MRRSLQVATAGGSINQRGFGLIEIMQVTVELLSTLQQEAGEPTCRFKVAADTVGGCLKKIAETRPTLYRCVCDETGAVRKHMNLFLNDSLLLRSEHSQTQLSEDDILFIMTAVSGG